MLLEHIYHAIISSLKHCSMSKSWCWDNKSKIPFLISLHIIILIQNMLLVDTPNFFRNIINSFLCEHITIITGTDGTHGYIKYISSSKYKWKYLAEAAIPGGKLSTTRQIILIRCAYNRSSEDFTTSITELNQTASFQAKVLQNLLMEQSGNPGLFHGSRLCITCLRFLEWSSQGRV